MGTQNQGLATFVGLVSLLFLALLIAGYVAGKA
jgi:hypothetical protein